VQLTKSALCQQMTKMIDVVCVDVYVYKKFKWYVYESFEIF